MKIIQELLAMIEASVGQVKSDFSKQRDAAYARAKWHKSMAQKHKADDPEAAKAHDEAEMDWINISQEYGHKNPTVAGKREAAAEAKLSKSKVARQETDEKYPS